eukprot:Sspe_Gene.57631::Locus_31612_Transcript_2_3_Confidence_0.500_Length_1221::g.57631::m.57631
MLLALQLLGLLTCAVGGSIDPRYAANITVYHVNPRSKGAVPVNMNTADVRGDIFFDLRSKALPIECAQDPTSMDCTNPEVTSSDLVVSKLVLEVDGRYGTYGRCNICVNHTDHHGDNNCTNGEYVCDCNTHWHSNVSVPCPPQVGRENVSLHYVQQKCKAGEPDWECWRSAISEKTGGWWYSTVKDGYCGAVGASDPCYWRVVEVVKVVNKTCSDNSIHSTVEAYGKPCFSACPQPTNTSSTCWIDCFYTTTLGPDAAKPGGAIAGIPLKDLITAWDAPFASEDPTKGGCPPL